MQVAKQANSLMHLTEFSTVLVLITYAFLVQVHTLIMQKGEQTPFTKQQMFSSNGLGSSKHLSVVYDQLTPLNHV